MIIKTASRTFSVFQILSSYQDITVYLAKDKADITINSDNYLINEICCKNLIQSCLEGLLTLHKEKNFSEFVDMFILDSNLYLVFKYTKPQLIMNYLDKHKLNFKERIKIAKSYLFQLSSYAPFSPAIVQSLTDPDNINIDSHGTIYFNFSLKQHYLFEPEDKSLLLNRIASFLKILFAKELAGKKGRQALIIIDKCEKSLYKSIPEIERDVQNIDTSSFWDKTKEYINSKKNTLKLILNLGLSVLTVIIIIFFYTNFIAPGPDKAPQQAPPITRISEVEIQSGQLEEKDEPIDNNNS